MKRHAAWVLMAVALGGWHFPHHFPHHKHQTVQVYHECFVVPRVICHINQPYGGIR